MIEHLEKIFNVLWCIDFMFKLRSINSFCWVGNNKLRFRLRKVAVLN